MVDDREALAAFEEWWLAEPFIESAQHREAVRRYTLRGFLAGRASAPSLRAATIEECARVCDAESKELWQQRKSSAASEASHCASLIRALTPGAR